MSKDAREISQAIDAMIVRLKSEEELAEVDLVCLTCLCYGLMWALDTNPSRKGLVREVVRIDLDQLSQGGAQLQSALDEALLGAKSQMRQEILEILKSRG